MRLLIALLLAAVAIPMGLVGEVRAERVAVVPAAGDTVYVAAGATVQYLLHAAPTPAAAYGPRALAGLDRARGHKSRPAPVLGVADPRGPLPAWKTRGLRGAASLSGPAPLGASFGARRRCRCKTRIADTTITRVGALFVTRSFRVGSELSSLRLLRARVRFRDGLVLYINGAEVARRNLARNALPMAPARRSRGPEWETFHIAVTPGLLREGENIIAAEVRPSSYRLAPYFDLELRGASRGRLVRGPMVQRVGPTSAVIAFSTDLPTQAVVEYGDKRGQLSRRVSSAGGGFAQHHAVRLDQLPAGKAVYYRVIAGAEVGRVYRFHTAPDRRKVIRFAVYGDVRGGHRLHRKILGAVLAEAPDFVLTTGDMVERGSDVGDWQRFFQVASSLLPRVPVYPAAGNHDLGLAGDERLRMNEIFVLWPAPPGRPRWGHWYSFDVADVHMVMLDSNSYEHAEQLAWLEADLRKARARGVRAIFAVTHNGPYSRGIHGGSREAAKLYAPVLARYRVSLLFSGHDHLYQRGAVRGLRYIVSGGGGAPRYPVTCGIPGKRRCRRKDGMKYVVSEYHYLMITVHRRHMRICARRPDRTLLEKCVRMPLRPRRARRR